MQYFSLAMLQQQRQQKNKAMAMAVGGKSYY